jgi:Icc-related predicted phosphoesterase
MVKILAVSDEELHPLRNESIEDLLPPDENEVDILLNCGDLSPHYLEYLIDKYRPKTRLMVHGNHDEDDYHLLKQKENQKEVQQEIQRTAGRAPSSQGSNHTFRNSGYSKLYLGMYVLNKDIYTINSEDSINNAKDDMTIAGYSGINIPNKGDKPFYFKKRDVNRFVRELMLKRFFGKYLGTSFNGIDIMMSHSAPKIRKEVPPDIDYYHRPSRELGRIYHEFHPKIWFYGHIHPTNTGGEQIDTLDYKIRSKKGTTFLLNTVPFKYIEFDELEGKVKDVYPKTYKTI